MTGLHQLRGFLAASCICLISTGVFAQAQEKKSSKEPQIGQEGKDVIWVPSALTLVNKMLDMAKVTPADYLAPVTAGQ